MPASRTEQSPNSRFWLLALALALIPAPAAMVVRDQSFGLSIGDVALTLLVGFAVALTGLRNLNLAAQATAAAAIAAVASLALVFYLGAVEVLAFGFAEPWIGGSGVLLPALPIVVFGFTLVYSTHQAARTARLHAAEFEQRSTTKPAAPEPPAPHFQPEPEPAERPTRTATHSAKVDAAPYGTHAALRAKLRNLRAEARRET